ncbi:MAG: nitrite reductase, copper-containing [Lentimicrobium sp.]|jgi:nitrite reductase (NO-forming)|nr:nitrite reductase, copper-containing [Lentimicrobium sp.]MDD2528789.1 copper-containing nitrite reductase [Lentimicrobiaceae bacterium]MDD4597554.1 copper-containing nitrite reductase [Lentimicrobiaceae bacterium]MDY0024629.1 copper-containing nitrite reductase [Lentimicrobium sp.]HAH59458.1 nitrite reductase, copper-containing [Bacteroidales bacterium]
MKKAYTIGSNATYFITLFLLMFFAGCGGPQRKSETGKIGRLENVTDIKGEEIAQLTDPPFVPPPITRNYATKVIVDLEIIEMEMELADGVNYVFWTFGGTVPGSFIRIREGDYVEFHLKNHPDNKLPHNIDLHAVTGQGGGAEATYVAPGYEAVFNFTAINPGLFVYHCATAPVGMHIANGMYGLILVEPKGGMSKVDKEYYVMQGDFYTDGDYGESGLQPFNMAKAIKEQPDYVVFNGHVGALTGERSLKATAGETVRLFVGNGGPNLASSFHLIGEVFDNVYIEGGSTMNHDIQTTMIPAGGSTITEFKVEVPGKFILVDHSIFRAFNKGALGILEVDGEENKRIYSGKSEPGIYQPSAEAINVYKKKRGYRAITKEEMLIAGKNLYDVNCAACHLYDGKGVTAVFPPVAKSDYILGKPENAINAVVNGLAGEITVNGVKYNSVMPKQALTDSEVVSVLTYIYNTFDGVDVKITEEQVKKLRK